MDKSKDDTQTHYQACNLCEAICGLEIRTRKNEIVSIKGDALDPLSQGHICPKAIALQDIYNDPERLRKPVKKTAEGWQEITWHEAYTEVSQRLRNIQQQHGKDAVGIYQGNPSVHSLGVMMYAKMFLRMLRTRNRFSATSVDQLPHHIVAGLMLGHEFLVSVPDIDRTQFMVMLGANPLVSNGSMMTVPNVGKRLQALQARGGKYWVIDPRFTETAQKADEHVFIQPGTDAHLLAAMVNTVFEEALNREGHLHTYLDGLESVREFVAAWTPEKVAPITGIPADTIRGMVRAFCAAETAVLYGRMGVSTQEFGTLCQWLIVVFNIITDNFDKVGGAMFTAPAIDVVANRAKKTTRNLSSFAFNRYRSRVKNLPEMQGELPVTTLADEIFEEGEGQIRAMFMVAGNPVLSTPNGERLSDGLAQLDFMVAVDSYINETTRHADIILPPTTILEREHYDLVFHALAVRNTARYSKPVFEPPKGSRSDGEIFIELAAYMNQGSLLSRVLGTWKSSLLKRFGLQISLDRGLRRGPYGKTLGLNLAKLKKAAHGIDLGALTPCLPQRLFTKNKRILLAPLMITADLTRLARKLRGENGHNQDNDEKTLLLIGRRDPRTCNSWMHNSKRLTKGRARCIAHIHPSDVAQLKLDVGVDIKVSSNTGSIILAFESTETIKQGVISIPHGWGHNLPGVRMNQAVASAGVSVNNVTDDSFYDALSGNAALNGVPVKVESVLITSQVQATDQHSKLVNH